MRRWAKWTLGVAAGVVGVVAFRFGVAFLRGDDAAAMPPVATHDADAFGDPLPEGAVARIGTIRRRARGPAVWAPDGEHLIVGGWDDELLAMNVRTGLVDWTMPGHAGKLAMNIGLRDVERIVRTGELPMVTDSLEAMVPLPGGHRLLTAGRSYRIWDLDARTEVRRIPIHGSAAPVTVSRDGTLAASPWNSSFVRVIDLATGARRARVEFGDQPQCAAFDADGTHVLAGFGDGRVGIARVAGGEAVFVKVSDAHILQILVPGDGHAFWAADLKGVVRIHSLDSPDAPPRVVQRSRADSGGYFVQMVASPDGRIVAVSWGGDEPIRWLDATTAEPVAGPTSESGLRGIGWSPDGKLFAAWEGRAIRVFGDGASAAPDLPEWPVGEVAFSPDGRSVALLDATTLRVADAATGTIRSKFDAGSWGASLAWTRDGAGVVLGMSGPRVVGIDAATGREAWVYDAGPPKPGRSSARIGPDGASAAWMDADGNLRVLDLRTENRVATVVPAAARSPNRGWYGLALSSGARRVAVIQELTNAESPSPSGTLPTLRVWNVGTESPSAEIVVARPEHLTLSRDGRFAAAGWRAGLDVFDLDASPPRAIGRVLWTIRDRDGWPGRDTGAAFSPDATRLAVGDNDGVVHVFALPSCAEIATFRGHRATIESVAFSDDGASLVSGSADMTALVWDLSKLPAAK